MKQLARNIYNNIRGGINGLKSTLIERFIPSLPSKTIRNLFIRWSGVKASKNVHFQGKRMSANYLIINSSLLFSKHI